MYINKNEIKTLDYKKCDMQDKGFVEFILNHQNAYILAPNRGTGKGTNDFDDVEYCASFEYLPVKNICFDCTRGQVYVNTANYDYIIPDEDAKSLYSRNNVRMLADSGFRAIRYNQRQTRYVLWDKTNGWNVDKIELIDYQCENNVIFNMSIIQLYNLSKLYKNGVSLETLWKQFLTCGKIQHLDFIEEDEGLTYLPMYKRLRAKHRQVLGKNDLRWEADDVANDYVTAINVGYTLNYNEVYDILAEYCSDFVGGDNKLDCCTKYLKLENVPQWYRRWLYSIYLFVYLNENGVRLKTHLDKNKYWFGKINYKGVHIMYLRNWL